MLSSILYLVNQKYQEPGESDEAFARRVLLAVNRLPDELRQALPSEVQAELNSMITRLNAGEVVVDAN
jgi:hypothetical protein